MPCTYTIYGSLQLHQSPYVPNFKTSSVFFFYILIFPLLYQFQSTIPGIQMADNLDRLGPYGNRNEENWSLRLSPFEKIRGVNIRRGLMVDAIEFVVEDKNGRTITRRFGGEGGDLNKIQFKQHEYITGIDGIHGFFEVNLQRLVASIKIYTNLNRSGYGPYASEMRCVDIGDFSISLPSLAFDMVEFFGRCSRYLESIGCSIRQTAEKVGPWGSPEPPSWDLHLGVHDMITEISVWSGYIVDKIEFVIADNHGKLTSRVFGGPGGGQNKIQLKPDEYVTNISGKYGNYELSGNCQLGTIKIHTNSNPQGYGPFGYSYRCNEVHEFSSSIPSDSVIVGLFGRANLHIDSIGVSTKTV